MSDRAVPVGQFADVGGGLRIHYHAAGAGEAVVFLHGSGPGASGFSNFQHNYRYVAERGFRAIVPDTLGFGYSSKPDVDYSLEFLATHLYQFIRAIGVDRCAVVGNSHGGAMAIRLALDHPEIVSKLVLMAPGGLESRETYMKMPGIRAMIEASTASGKITREQLRRVFALQLFDSRRLSEAILDERMAIAALQPARVFTTLSVPDLTSELSRLTCPLFAFWGVDDNFCPVGGAMTIARNCKQAKVLLLSECGHWVMVEHPDTFNSQTVSFIKNR